MASFQAQRDDAYSLLTGVIGKRADLGDASGRLTDPNPSQLEPGTLRAAGGAPLEVLLE
jgi:hypothetical protein